MIRPLTAAFFALCAFNAYALPAFPGAEGFGADTIGGRGGKVIHVTNLENAGPGSLRAAIDEDGPRIVVFDVSGTIELWNALIIHNPYITIAGQTAPGDGITLKGDTFGTDTHDVVVRFIRSRMGDANPRAEDAISIQSGYNIVFDHVSASWSIDEAFSPSGSKSAQLHDITIQWCAIAEPLNQSKHKKGNHGYNMLLRATGGISLHHNLFAHADSRNPRFGDNYFRGDAPTYDFRNNVIYDWGHIASGMVDGRMNVNYVSNYLKPGPSTVDARAPIVLTDKANEGTRFYVDGNVVAGRETQTADGKQLFATENVKSGNAGFTLMPAAFTVPAVTTASAAEAYTQVLAGAGASFRRDPVDERIMREVASGSGRIINTTDEVGGWPQLKSLAAPQDRDGDGMPDAWETANGLDPDNPADGTKLRADGYTEVEHYLNSLVNSAHLAAR
jgi:pectate lyase